LAKLSPNELRRLVSLGVTDVRRHVEMLAKCAKESTDTTELRVGQHLANLIVALDLITSAVAWLDCAVTPVATEHPAQAGRAQVNAGPGLACAASICSSPRACAALRRPGQPGADTGAHVCARMFQEVARGQSGSVSAIAAQLVPRIG